MDIQPMPCKILLIANAMIRKSLLPDFPAADLNPHSMRVSALDQLHRALQSHVRRWREQQMNVVGHQHKGMHVESSPSPVAIKSLQEEPGIRVHDEESAPLKSREGYEISSWRRDPPSRFHCARPQRLKPEVYSSLFRCDCKSHPSRSKHFPILPFWESRTRPHSQPISPSPHRKQSQTPANTTTGKGTVYSRAAEAATRIAASAAGGHIPHPKSFPQPTPICIFKL